MALTARLEPEARSGAGGGVPAGAPTYPLPWRRTIRRIWGARNLGGEGTESGFTRQRPCGERLPWKSWVLNAAGVGLALYVFMADALRVASQGPDAVRNVLPHWFNWPLFAMGLVLMAAPIARVVWLRTRPMKRTAAEPVLAEQTELRG